MMRSMFSGVSGTRNHQIRMDVIGNNIANVNTVGFKYGRVTFQDALSQTLRGASAPRQGRGGVNPMQVGLGTSLRSIDTVFTQGSIETTGKLTDMAIQGAGFFAVSNEEGSIFYSRDGAFSLDASGQVIHPSTGFRLQGWAADSAGSVDTSKPVEGLRIPLGQSMTAKATQNLGITGNLNAQANVGDFRTTSVPVYDSLGVRHTISMVFTKTYENEWEWEATFGDPPSSVGSGIITMRPDGKVDDVSSTTIQFDPQNGALDVEIEVDFNNITQYGQGSSINWSYQDGFPAGSLETFTIDDNGAVIGVYSNGQYDVLGQIVLATFSNPEGLAKVGGNLYKDTSNSGSPLLGEAGKEGRGTILGGNLEMSNVDLAREFTDMIITQRGFQANSRLITTADEMLQELLSLKR